jgi:peroxiredoxin Q/BCP
MTRTLVAAAVLSCAFAGSARAQETAPVSSSLEVGDAAPAFTTKDHEGKTVSLADFKGKRVVLWFYPKADTGGWTLEGCGFRDLSKDFDKKGVVILGISHDTPEANAKFAKKNGFPFELLSDTDGAISKAYGAVSPRSASYSRRNTYVIGKDGKLEKVLVDVNPTDHAKALLDALPE